ncbi:MAG: TrkA family potassium uptake protein [Actinomycetota bacterium]|nr:TrkA family potassium uptake protein [Actinomycetota bacterium]
MHIIVVGCGRVGSELGTRLSVEGHSVVIIDKNASAFRRLGEHFSGRTIPGLGFDRQHLELADIGSAGALAAVTSGDNSNILTARIAREVYGVPKVVARIYDPRRAEIYRRLGIQTVATVTWTTDQAMRRIFDAASQPDWTDPNGNVVLVEKGVPPHLLGKRLGKLEEIAGVKPVLLTRGTSTRLFQPDIVAQEGDLMHFMVEREAIASLEIALGGKEKKQ